MKMVGLNAGQIHAFTILSFLIMLLVEGVIIWQLLHRKRGPEDTGGAALSKEQATKEFEVPSATEHTTRTLEPPANERKLK